MAPAVIEHRQQPLLIFEGEVTCLWHNTAGVCGARWARQSTGASSANAIMHVT